MKTYTNIVVTGSMSWDIIMDYPARFVDQLAPDKLHQLNVSFVVDKLEKQLGGIATNISYAASQTMRFVRSKQEKPKAIRVLGGLGKDGRDHTAFFKKHNISDKGIITDNRLYCATGTVITDSKDNQLWGFYYGASIRGKDVKFSRFIDEGSLLIVSATHPEALIACQNYAIKHKIDYLYDVGMSLSWMKDKDLKNGVMHAAYLIGNDYEIAMITKRLRMSVGDLTKKGIRIITTLGEKGVKYDSDAQKTVHIPAVRIAKVVDPTGAGDAWRGGFMTSCLMGLDMTDCLRIGNVVASFAIEHYGTVSYRILRADFTKRLQQLQ